MYKWLGRSSLCLDKAFLHYLTTCTTFLLQASFTYALSSIHKSPIYPQQTKYESLLRLQLLVWDAISVSVLRLKLFSTACLLLWHGGKSPNRPHYFIQIYVMQYSSGNKFTTSAQTLKALKCIYECVCWPFQLKGSAWGVPSLFSLSPCQP